MSQKILEKLTATFGQVVPLNRQANYQQERCIGRLRSYQSSVLKDLDSPISQVQNTREIPCYASAKYNSQVIYIPVQIVDFLKLTIL